MDQTKILNIYTDGGSRGNPGPGALGVHIENDQGEVLEKIGKALGVTTNNVAEYSAIIAGLTWVIRNKNQMPDLSKINFFMDSQLAAAQLNGIYKVKNPKIRELFFLIKQKEAEINSPIYYSHIPREQNKKADKLVNEALDGKI
ncbi:MAG: Ribonuclease H [Microgenomates group bacterium GW2011_GWA2_37_6]|nr:MAG: Ribonuclease H [Microgenomates group bacterium GW2011_GWA2_37_6]